MQFEQSISSSSSSSSSSSASWLGRLKTFINDSLSTYKPDFDTPAPYCPPRFAYDDPKLVEYFDENGYVVIKGVADDAEVQKGIKLFWDLAESQQPLVKRDDPSTWEPWIADSSVGIMSGYGIGQSEFLWYARTLPKVKPVFSRIWGDENLLVSFDGCGVFRPFEYKPSWKTIGGWYHIDQNCHKKKGRHAIQGLINFFPSGPHDGGFVVVPKSTHMIDAAFEKYDMCSTRQRDFVKLYPDDPAWKEAVAAVKRDESTKYDLIPVKLVLEAGDMVLWDSRAIHCNHPPTKPNPSPHAKTQLKRLAAYVCMTPSSLASDLEELVKYRVHAFQWGISTTHWPHQFQPSWVAREKLAGVGASVVRLTPEQAKLITGTLDVDVYDEEYTKGVDLNNLKD